MDTTTTLRIVPGAPPPTPLTKSQKKKRQTKRKIADSSVESSLQTLSIDNNQNGVVESEVKEGSSPQVDSVSLQEQKTQSLDVQLKPSPIVDLVHKRLKVTTKKIGRITSYAATDVEKLNDDQRRTLKTLPALEAVQKELGEVKKAVEVHEAELSHELALKRVEADIAEKNRLNKAIAEVERSNAASTSALFNLLRLHAALAAGHPDAVALDEVDYAAVFAAADIILGTDNESQQALIRGFFSREGEFHGTTYARLADITHLYTDPNPPSAAPTAQQEPDEDQDHPEMADSLMSTIDGVSDPEALITTKPSTGSFDFMQASEVEPSFGESSVEWVERADAIGLESDVGREGGGGVMAQNGHVYMDESTFPTEGLSLASSVEGALDWADDESGLPSIDGLHAKFGTPESATPVGEISAAEDEGNQRQFNINSPNDTNDASHDDEGFTQARGGRGRARGERGERGNMRGGFRGGRGDRDRGFRGFRGGERSGFRGRSAPNGEWRGDGDGRGRGGRGRGRGGDRAVFNENRGGAPPPT